jgi:hypothetical protein
MMQRIETISFKFDTVGAWIEREWVATHPEYEWVTLWAHYYMRHDTVLAQVDRGMDFGGGFRFVEVKPIVAPELPRIQSPYGITGAYRYVFVNPATDERFDALVTMQYVNDDGYQMNVLVCAPRQWLVVWEAFYAECVRLHGKLHAGQRVYVIGGRRTDFYPTVRWDDIILDDTLKGDVLNDVRKFYGRGVGIYNRLNLKPFRKLLFAGVPGTGKTMLCTGLAKWALDQGYLVIYVSSADCDGPNFAKIERALTIAAQAECPTLIVLEEIDAYLHKQQKAMVLNVLDGNESQLNAHGTLLIATTNYPEAIDERVLKRPGRLDRIFIVPPLTNTDEAERMLKLYLGAEWREEHRELASRLVGYTGAFVREVAIYALTQYADAELADLPVEMLVASFEALQTQLEARDAFVQDRPEADDDAAADPPYRPMQEWDVMVQAY